MQLSLDLELGLHCTQRSNSLPGAALGSLGCTPCRFRLACRIVSIAGSKQRMRICALLMKTRVLCAQMRVLRASFGASR